MKNKSALFIIHYSLYILIIIMLLSCTTQPETGNLSGTVQLQDQTDHSGITVALYELSELDQDIVAINEEYDFIGVIINQHTEFDHRFGNLTKYTQTDAYGNFKIKDIPTSRYNVVAIKDSFGFRYIYNVQINNGNNSLHASRSTLYASRSSDLTLFPVTYISSNIDTSTTWQADHHYIIENDIYVSGDLTIKPGAIIRIEKDKKLTISGDLIAIGEGDNEENMIWFTSNDSIRFPSSILPSPYKSVELTSSLNKQVSFCKFDHAGTGLLNYVNGFSISDCIFRNSSCGFKSENVDSAFCSNLLCENITNEDGGIYFNTILNGFIKNNIIINSKTGIKLKYHCSDEIIYNNYITDCYNGIIVTFYSNSTIRNNNIYNCEKNILVAAQSEPYIHHNIINGNWNFYLYYEPGSNVFDACPIIENNNLEATEYFYYISKYNKEDIITHNNYYGLDENEIESMIYDKDDYPEEYQDLVGNVIYSPSSNANVNCGIQ